MITRYFFPYLPIHQSSQPSKSHFLETENRNDFQIEETISSFIRPVSSGICELLWNTITVTVVSGCLPIIPLLFRDSNLLFSWLDILLHIVIIFCLVFPLFSLYYYEATRFSLIIRSRYLQRIFTDQKTGEVIGDVSGSERMLLRCILFITNQDLKYWNAYKGNHSFISVLCYSKLSFWLVVEMIVLFLTRMEVSGFFF
jgi:hypothetical protein